VPGKVLEQLELPRRERHRLAVDTHLGRADVDHQPAITVRRQ
jgi:hypothetical protein